MAIALVSRGAGNSIDSNGFTTGALSTTGANFIVIGLCTADGTRAISDSKGNTYTALTQFQDSFSDRFYQLFIAKILHQQDVQRDHHSTKLTTQ